MSQMIDFTLPSCQPGRTLHAFRCVPEGEVRAVLQLSHGMVEFIDRYKPLAENLAARGILVTGNDHLGHGGSIRTKEDYGYFGEPDGNRHPVVFLQQVRHQLRSGGGKHQSGREVLDRALRRL